MVELKRRSQFQESGVPVSTGRSMEIVLSNGFSILGLSIVVELLKLANSMG